MAVLKTVGHREVLRGFESAIFRLIKGFLGDAVELASGGQWVRNGEMPTSCQHGRSLDSWGSKI